MRKGKATLSADDITVTCGLVNGRRVLRVCRPRGGPSLAPKQLGIMQLAFDESSLCPSGGTAQRNRTNPNCKKLFDMLLVPIGENLPDREVTSRGRQVVNACFGFYAREDTRARTSTTKETEPVYRVYGPARSAGPVGSQA